MHSLLYGNEQSARAAAATAALDGLVLSEAEASAQPAPVALEQCKFRCPSCGRRLKAALRREGATRVQCTCGATFEVNVPPPSAEEEGQAAAKASAEFFAFSAAAAAAIAPAAAAPAATANEQAPDES